MHDQEVYRRRVRVTDTQFRVGVTVAGAALVGAIVAIRFCGTLPLPAKPPPPTAMVPGSSRPARELFASASATSAVYLDFIVRDAAAAGLRPPTIDELSRKLPYRVDDARHVLEVGEPALELAGVRLRALRLDDALALEITNTTASDLAYDVVSAPIPATACTAVAAVPFNAMTLRRERAETRVECGWHDGNALAVTRVETLEVPALSSWYLEHLPPSIVGIEPRIARGHRAAETLGRCSSALPQAVRSGLERGEIGWRDLVDFYARHRCQTYQFPLSYRAFEKDHERAVPAAPEGM